jgi:hypothetical protein
MYKHNMTLKSEFGFISSVTECCRPDVYAFADVRKVLTTN